MEFESKWSSNKFQCECKSPKKDLVCKENHIWNPSIFTCEINNAYMKSLIKDSVVSCDEIIDAVATLYDDTPETVSINSNNKT